MFKNYIVTAIRNMIRQKLFTAINILGLAVGIAASILVTIYVRYDMSFDQHWSKLDSIYRADMKFLGNPQFTSRYNKVSGQAQNAYLQTFPEDIEAAARVRHLPALVKVANSGFDENMSWTDADITRIFDFEIIAGDLNAVLQGLHGVAVSQSFAEKYFGEENPIGQTLDVSVAKLKRDYKIGAVFKDMPETSTLQVQTLARIDEEAFQTPNYIIKNWGSTSVEQYLLLKDSGAADRIRAGTTAMLDRFVPDDENKGSRKFAYELAPFSDFHLHWVGGSEMSRMGQLSILIAIAAALIIIASINFINLATARSIRRAQEVALRKVLGAERRQLIGQFLIESCLTVLVSLFVALAIVEASLPAFSDFLEVGLSFNVFEAFWLGTSLLIVLFVGLVAGAYPALVVSGWRPAFVLHANKSSETKGSVRLRQILVTCQFIASIILMVVTFSVYGQSQYSLNIDPGFERENLMVVQALSRDELSGKRLLLAEQVRALPNVVNAGLSVETPSDDNNNFGSFIFDGAEGQRKVNAGEMYVGPNFFETYGLKLVGGRAFDDGRVGDELSWEQNEDKSYPLAKAMVNETTAREMGFSIPADAIGQTLRWYDNRPLEVIGVVQNAMTQSLRSEAGGEVYFLRPTTAYALTVRFTGSPSAIVADVEQIWNEVAPTVPFVHDFVDEMVAREFASEQRATKLLMLFSSVAVIVACLGLYGLASFTAERRTKEIGIRKVLGANVVDIVRLLIWQFSTPVLVANLIAWPLAFYAMSSWLEQFPYRISSLSIVAFCLLAGGVALLIAWITVGGNAARVAKANPVHALRYE